MSVSTITAGPETDAAVAKALGLHVVGFETCAFWNGRWEIQPGTAPENFNVPAQLRPVLVAEWAGDPLHKKPLHAQDTPQREQFVRGTQCPAGDCISAMFYSTDPAAAMEAFERFVVPKAAGGEFPVPVLYRFRGQWRCSIVDQDWNPLEHVEGHREIDGFQGEADTMPLAVCRYILQCEAAKP